MKSMLNELLVTSLCHLSRFLLLYDSSPTSGTAVLHSKLVDGRCQISCRPSRSELSVVFVQNSRKYLLGFLKKTPTVGTPLIGHGLTSGQSALTASTQTLRL